MTVEKSKKRKERKGKKRENKKRSECFIAFCVAFAFLGVSANYSCEKKVCAFVCVCVCATANVFVSVRVASLN